MGELSSVFEILACLPVGFARAVRPWPLTCGAEEERGTTVKVSLAHTKKAAVFLGRLAFVSVPKTSHKLPTLHVSSEHFTKGSNSVGILTRSPSQTTSIWQPIQHHSEFFFTL